MRHIAGDRLEQSRIRLEHDLNNNIPSPPHMSRELVADSVDVSSVEFGRHNSHQHPSFHSFEHPSHLDSDFYSRHEEDESIALEPDLGHTMSTAAHHASALTLSAGLRGRGLCDHTSGSRSPSGMEYDPDRPLQAMLGNCIPDGMSLLNASARSKSKSSKSLKYDQTRSLPTFDPVIVDSTAELDRFLRTGRHHPAATRSSHLHSHISRSHSQPVPGVSDPSDSDMSSPRLSQALDQHFSPKRPRSVPTPASANHTHFSPTACTANPAISQTTQLQELEKSKSGHPKVDPTLKLSQKGSMSERITPVSQVPKLSHRIARNVEVRSRLPRHNHDRNQGGTPRPHRHPVVPSSQKPSNTLPSASALTSGNRTLFSNIVNKIHNEPKGTRGSTRVHLPDVTGLTSAVQSPVKGGIGYVNADAHPSLAADFLPTLDALETRLQVLERENTTSRRRMRELELELEECKVEVIKERTRVERYGRAELERERVSETHNNILEGERRYKEVLDEKRALEALILTLRTHLSRLTSELASHQSLVADLRKLRETDAHETRVEIEALREEVDRLAGEVERLKEVVEEGLRERRRAREGSEHSTDEDVDVPAQLGIDLTYVTVPRDMEKDPPAQDYETPVTMADLEPEQNAEFDESSEPEPLQDSESDLSSSHTRQYIQATELARVESEMQERRSERSRSATKSNTSAQSRANNSGNGSSLHEVEPAMVDHDPSPASSPARPSVHPRPFTEGPTTHEHKIIPPVPPPQSTPFPQIRGSRMERLFFSVPEHNAKTCTVCYRRKRGAGRHTGPSWIGQSHHPQRQDDSEGEFVKNYLKNQVRHTKTGENCGQATWKATEDNRLPPQTVLMRVVRELEDDFTHYKAIYLELAEQYGIIDAASNVAKRNVLADHLREVIDTLEQKGDQIASLYDLLMFEDKPTRHAFPPNPKRSAS